MLIHLWNDAEEYSVSLDMQPPCYPDSARTSVIEVRNTVHSQFESKACGESHIAIWQ